MLFLHNLVSDFVGFVVELKKNPATSKFVSLYVYLFRDYGLKSEVIEMVSYVRDEISLLEQQREIEVNT